MVSCKVPHLSTKKESHCKRHPVMVSERSIVAYFFKCKGKIQFSFNIDSGLSEYAKFYYRNKNVHNGLKQSLNIAETR